jgi:hypothetical protein
LISVHGEVYSNQEENDVREVTSEELAVWKNFVSQWKIFRNLFSWHST